MISDHTPISTAGARWLASRRGFLGLVLASFPFLSGFTAVRVGAALDKLEAWGRLLQHRQAAARIGSEISLSLGDADAERLLTAQRARLAVAATPSLDLLQDMIAEDFRNGATVSARGVMFSEVEAAVCIHLFRSAGPVA